MILVKKTKIFLVAFLFIISLNACGISNPEVPLLINTQSTLKNLSTSDFPKESEIAIATTLPDMGPTQIIMADPTLIIDSPHTHTPGSTSVCPPSVAHVTPIKPVHPSNDYKEEIQDYLNAGATTDELRRMLNELEYFDNGILWQASGNLVIADVTADATPDIILSLLFFAPGEPVFGSGYVFYCRNGRYIGEVIIDLGYSASFVDPTLNQTIGLRSLPDTNLNGIPEIVFSYIGIDNGNVSIKSGQDYARWFQILEWTGSEFVDLLPDYVYNRNALVVVNGNGTFEDTDGDGYPELILHGGALRESGHGHRFFRSMTTIWEWDGSGFTLNCITASAPVYRFQAVEDGDAAMLCQNDQKALTSFQQAIFDESLIGWSEEFLWMLPGEPNTDVTPIPDPDERALLSAYSRYRLMLIQLANGDIESASIEYDTLLSTYPVGSIGHQYVQIASTVWNEYSESGDLSSTCRLAIQQASSREDLAPLAERYTYFSIIYAKPEYICPY